MTFFISTIAASPTLVSIVGSAIGCIIVKPVAYAGARSGVALASAAQLSKKNQVLVATTGATSATALFVTLLGTSPFETGIKIALVVNSVIMGINAKDMLTHKESRDVRADSHVIEALGTIIAVISGIWIGMVSATSLHPAVGCYLGALSASVINYAAICLRNYLAPQHTT